MRLTRYRDSDALTFHLCHIECKMLKDSVSKSYVQYDYISSASSPITLNTKHTYYQTSEPSLDSIPIAKSNLNRGLVGVRASFSFTEHQQCLLNSFSKPL